MIFSNLFEIEITFCKITVVLDDYYSDDSEEFSVYLIILTLDASFFSIFMKSEGNFCKAKCGNFVNKLSPYFHKNYVKST